MTRQLEETAPRVGCEFFTQGRRGPFPHVPVNFGDLAQPTRLHCLEKKFKRRIVAQHISHLDRQPALLRLGMQRTSGRQGLPGRLIKMNVLACSKASQGGGNELIELGLDRNDLNAGI